jgi:hypothetical protein
MPEPSGRTFVLDVDTDPAAEGAGVARLRLSDGEG